MKNVTDEHGQMAVEKFWKLKKSLTSPDCTKASIISRSNVELFSASAIISEYELEFSNRLSHRKIDPRFQEYESLSNSLFRMIL